MDEINTYYPTIDKLVLGDLCKNNNFKNLVKLSTHTDISLFNKKNKLKGTTKLLKECEQIKKKELKKSSLMLSNLAKLNNINNIDNVHSICQDLESKITNIDKIIDCVKVLETTPEVKVIPKEYLYNDFIECYSNC